MSKKKDVKKPPKAEKVRTAKDVKGATLRAIRVQSGKAMDNMTQPNDGINHEDCDE